jgi:hypothetical protein
LGKTKTKGSATERGLEAHLSADGEEPRAIDVAIAGDVVATLDEGGEVIRKPNVEAEDESGDESAFFLAGVFYIVFATANSDQGVGMAMKNPPDRGMLGV